MLFEILPDIEICGLTLFLPKESSLIFADTHLGYEGELQDMGYLVPRFQFELIKEHLTRVFTEIKPKVKKIIINGDLKHEFSKISFQEWNEVFEFIDFLKEFSEDITLVRGNHDTIIEPIKRKTNIEVVEGLFLRKSKVYVHHGHKMPKDKNLEKAKTIVIAHDHPCIGLRENLRIEKVKCFILGTWNGKKLIQIPSLNFVTEGSDILRESFLSPFMKQDISDFEVICVEEFEIFQFGKVKDLLNELY